MGEGKEEGPVRPPGPVLVVGPCAAGKTTLVENLRRMGIPARSVAQEHSQAPHLFARAGPGFLVYLDVTYEAVTRRRPVPWGPERLEEERGRLSLARSQAQLVVHTDHLTPQEVAQRVAQAWREAGGQPVR
jgi:predicted ATPase